MRKMHTLLYSIARTKMRRLPYKLNYAVTYQCNAQCNICNIWRTYTESPEKQKEELKLPEIEAIFKDFDLSWVSLTGGEPFLREDLADIASVIKDSNPHLELLSIPTNGSLPHTIFRTVERILEETEISNIYVSVSLDGDEPLHDRLRGVEGLWKKARTTYELLNSIEDDRFNLVVEFTVSKYNAGHLQRALDSFGVTDYSGVVLTAAHSSYFYCTEKQKLHEASSVAQVNQFRSLNRGSSLESILPSVYTCLLEKYIQGDLIPLQCVSGRSSLFLDPYGFLYPCITMEKAFGNLKDSSLPQLLHTENARTIFRTIREGKCPGCWTPCEAYQTILENFPKALVSAYLR